MLVCAIEREMGGPDRPDYAHDAGFLGVLGPQKPL